jgi:hypothetical protein
MTVWSATGTGEYFHRTPCVCSGTNGRVLVTQFPAIPLDVYQLCLTRTARFLTVLQISISLFFGKFFLILPHLSTPRTEPLIRPPPSDIAVFALVIIQAHLIRSRYQGIGGPNVLDRVSKDAGIYFGVIATSHFVIVIMFAAARVRFLTQPHELNMF